MVNDMNLFQQQTTKALKKWHKMIFSYRDDEIYLDDLERILTQNMSDFQAQIYLLDTIDEAESSTLFLHGDLLVNTLMVELGDTRQIHYYLYAELNSFDKNNEILSIFYVASGFEKAIIESGSRDRSSTKVSNSIALMKKWCLHVSDEAKFKTIILDRLIDRVLQNPIKEDSHYLRANKFANHVVYTGSEKLRNS